MEKQDFDSMPRDAQWEHLTTHLEDLKTSVRSRIAILPQVAALSATLIVVATLNPNLVPLSKIEARILLTLFLWLVPLTLHAYVYDLSRAEEKHMSSIGVFLGHDLSKEIARTQKYVDKVIAWLPHVTVFLFYFVIAYISFKIWICF